ncbi:MAG: hypothetical protein KC505_10570, partial [Myxococcales bacterium]|nr:hypothetical protein [Myxococcales bacterium]
VGPGIIALIAIENDSFVTRDIIALPFKNPQYFVAQSNSEVWVSCSGSYHDINSNPAKSDNAGLVKIVISAKQKLSVSSQITMNNFTPAIPTFIDGKLVVPEAWGNRIAVLEVSATSLKKEHIKTHSYHRPFALTLAKHWHDDIVFLISADANLIAYSLKDGFFPFPFVEPIKLNKDQNKKVVINPAQLFIRDYSETYVPGYNLWALSPVTNQIYPLDLMEIFGP